MENLLHTPLHSLHLEYQAKMVAFAGYHMPIQYAQGILHEHLHCRTKTGLFDISHMGQLLITGDQVAAALEQVSPGKIATLQSGQQRYCVLTNTQGGIIDDLVITRFSSEYLLVVNASRQQTDIEYLQQHLPDTCRIESLDSQALLALQGPAAVEVLKKLAPDCTNLNFMAACKVEIQDMSCRIFRSGYTGEDGFEISVAADHAEPLARLLLAQQEVEWVGLGARNTLRLEAGLCLYGQDLTAEITPVEARLSWTLRKQTSGFPGANVINGQLQDGATKKRVGLLPKGKVPVRANTILLDDENKQLGFVSSGGYSPSLERPIAMGYIDTHAARTGHIVYANIRNRRITLTLTDLPFVPHRYYRK